MHENFGNFCKKKKILQNSTHKLSKEDNSHTKPQNDNAKNPVGQEAGLEFLDGISTGTSRFIIDREFSPDILENHDIKDLENKGRYYLAKIANQV